MAVIELCRSCGFDIPADADRCPGCAPSEAASLAARQVAGLALPTRSVRALSTVQARRDLPAGPLGRARTARSAFSFTTAMVLFTVAAASLGWVAGQPRFVLQLPDGTVGLLHDVTNFFATASIVALVVGLVAMVAWCIRAAAHAARLRVNRRRYA